MRYKRTEEEQQNIMKIIVMFARSMGVGMIVMLAIIALYHIF